MCCLQYLYIEKCKIGAKGDSKTKEGLPMKMKELPELERPYERLESYGPEALTDAELLAIIIKTGTKEFSSVQIAQELLKLDDEKKGISFLKDISMEELQKKKGIGRVKAIQLKAVAELAYRIAIPKLKKNIKINTPEDISNMFMAELKVLKQETIKTLLLNSKNQIIKTVTNALGGINSSYIEPKDIFREPIRTGATKIALVHNHPSGDPAPSKADILMTRNIATLGEMLGIEVIDHIIIGNGVFCSLKRIGKF